jgi:hypothetical protein
MLTRLAATTVRTVMTHRGMCIAAWRNQLQDRINIMIPRIRGIFSCLCEFFGQMLALGEILGENIPVAATGINESLHIDQIAEVVYSDEIAVAS